MKNYIYTPKERLKSVLEGRKADRPPCICPGGMMNMVTAELMKRISVYMPEAHKDARQMAELSKAVYESGCFENYGVPFCMTVEAEEMGARVDMGSVIYEPHVKEYPLESVGEFKRLAPADLSRGRAKVVLEAIRILKDETKDVPVVGNLTGPISTAGSLVEPAVLYKEMRRNRQGAHGFMEFITDWLITFGKAQIEAGADVIAIADPSGTGEILGPKLFREFVVTYINKLADALKEKGVPTIVHICGQMRSVYKEVKDIRSDALSFDSLVPMREAREHLADRVLMGNVSTYALEFGDKKRVKMLARGCVKNGSDIISPACGLSMKSPLGNVQAILESLKGEV